MNPWVVQSFLTFDSIDKTLYCGAVYLFNFTQFVNLENLSILDLALSGLKGLIFNLITTQTKD